MCEKPTRVAEYGISSGQTEQEPAWLALDDVLDMLLRDPLGLTGSPEPAWRSHSTLGGCKAFQRTA